MSVGYKPGVQFTTIAPAGYRILDAIRLASAHLGLDLVITCACEAHPPDDPHSTGEAFDVRTHGFTATQKQTILKDIMHFLQRGDMDIPIETANGLATMYFFGQLEHPNESNEHIHLQRRRATTYTVDHFLKA